MNRTQKKTLFLLLGILVGLGILLAVVSAVKRSSAQREAEEAAAQDHGDGGRLFVPHL